MSREDLSRRLLSFSASIQQNDMDTHQASYPSSVTDDDLEEARQRLLAHQYHQETEDSEPNHVQHQIATGQLDRQHQRATGQLDHPGDLPPPVVVVDHLPTDNLSRGSRYGSVSTTASVTTHKRSEIHRKRYRLPLLILLGFNWGLVVFLSIVCWVLHKLDNQDFGYFSLEIQKGYFDLVIIATTAAVLNILAYVLLAWVTRIIMAITTLASAFYVPVKTYFLLNLTLTLNGIGADDIAKDPNQLIYLISLLMLVFISFVVPWLVAFFFEFKFLPAEKARLNVPSWWKILPWVWPRVFVIRDTGTDTPSLNELPQTPPVPPNTLLLPPPSRRVGLSNSTPSTDFRTPLGSSRGSPVLFSGRYHDDDLTPITEEPPLNELATPECDRRYSPEDQRLKSEADEALNGMIKLTRNNDGWVLDRTVNGIKCYTKQINGRKVLKMDGVVETSARSLWSILYPGKSMMEWNTQCACNDTLHKVDEMVDVVYTVSNAMGPVSTRDFVSVRRIAFRDGAYYSASKSTVSAIKPEESGKVRGENGPCGYVVIPLSSSSSQFIWVLNSNLKGWLPQTVVDQAVTSAVVTAYQQLQIYAGQQETNS